MWPAEVAAFLLGLSIVPGAERSTLRGRITPELIGRSGISARIRSPSTQPSSAARVALMNELASGGESDRSIRISSSLTVTETEIRDIVSIPWPSYSTQSWAV